MDYFLINMGGGGAIPEIPIFSMFLEKKLRNSRYRTECTGLLERR